MSKVRRLALTTKMKILSWKFVCSLPLGIATNNSIAFWQFYSLNIFRNICLSFPVPGLPRRIQKRTLDNFVWQWLWLFHSDSTDYLSHLSNSFVDGRFLHKKGWRNIVNIVTLHRKSQKDQWHPHLHKQNLMKVKKNYTFPGWPLHFHSCMEQFFLSRVILDMK